MNTQTDPGQLGGLGTSPLIDVPAPVALWAALVAAHAALDRSIDHDASGCLVVGPDVLGVLLPLALSSRGRLRLGDLAERAGLTPSGLTRRVEALEAGGFVDRVTCDSDRRGVYAAITASGRDALPGALEHYAAVLDRAIGRRLDPAETARLTALLEAMATP